MPIAILSVLLRREVLIPALLLAAALWINHRAYTRGHEAAEASQAAAVALLRDKLSATSRELFTALAAIEADRLAFQAEIERLEDDAQTAAGADRLSLPADSVQRLRARWGR